MLGLIVCSSFEKKKLVKTHERIFQTHHTDWFEKRKIRCKDILHVMVATSAISKTGSTPSAPTIQAPTSA